MLPKWHILFGFLATLILKFTTSLNDTILLVIFFSSFLIDVDHWLLYVYRKKDLSIKNAYNWFIEKKKKYLILSAKEKRKYKHPLMIFHGIEFWILLFILSIFSKIFVFILIGFAIHLLFDYLEILYLGEPLYIKFSQIWLCIKNKNKKKFY